MYSEADLDSAVRAGALSPAAVTALRDHVATVRATPAVDEESFRLLTGFNDIFVAIAAAAVLAGAAQLGASAWLPIGGAAVAVVSWGLAEYFTRRRRMALPSILLLLGYVGGIAAALVGVVIENQQWLEAHVPAAQQQMVASFIAAAIAAITAGGAWLHWKRFMVPITVAAGALAAVGIVVALILALVPGAEGAIFPIVLVAGIAMFALAMGWDMTDLERRTRRSDVAFWLHLAAAPMIAHSLFHMLGVFAGGTMQAATAAAVIALYIGFALVALAVDRRALLVSSLAYVLYALYALFAQAGAVALGAGLTALVIGSALLTLSAFWQPLRRAVVGALGSLRHRLPPVSLAIAS